MALGHVSGPASAARSWLGAGVEVEPADPTRSQRGQPSERKQRQRPEREPPALAGSTAFLAASSCASSAALHAGLIRHR